MLVELRERSEAMLTPSIGVAIGAPRDAISEASIALQQLGYKPLEISRMLKDAQNTDSAEDIIRHALKSALRG